MQTNALHQEILLVTTSSLSRRQLTHKDAAAGRKPATPSEQLEEACWNGLLEELLPEVMVKPALGKRLYVWHIRQGRGLLRIALGEYPLAVDKYTSINPDFFLSEMFPN
ncbi:hypothetical protein V9K67_21155 [Paraflavisolibacter sp. H34]|uniref:hypothetical protein n=1 Tax=Huijunlia imazamoxiresistens TaxID=3127457 RepID=UPI00301614E8